MYTSKEKKPLSSYCSILGVSEHATSKEIRKAWYKKSLKVHPDKNTDTDTTEAFKQLTQAYEILFARASKKENSTDLPFFSSKSTNKSKSTKKSKTYNSSTIFQFEHGWSVKIYEDGFMFISHPTLRGCKNDITIFQYENRPFIGLPLNFNETLRNRLWKQLTSVCRDYENWHLSHVELCFGLPENRSVWPDIMDCIFRAYKTPLPLSQFLKQQLGLPASDQKKSIPDFYSLPGMHCHDRWESRLTGRHLFLTHPEITKTAPLTFFNLFEPKYFITLPVNNSSNSFTSFNEKLLPLVHEKPVMNNLCEIVIKLNKSEDSGDILEYIFDFYDIPERIAKPIRQECLTSVTADSNHARGFGI